MASSHPAALGEGSIRALRRLHSVRNRGKEKRHLAETVVKENRHLDRIWQIWQNPLSNFVPLGSRWVSIGRSGFFRRFRSARPADSGWPPHGRAFRRSPPRTRRKSLQKLRFNKLNKPVPTRHYRLCLSFITVKLHNTPKNPLKHPQKPPKTPSNTLKHPLTP